MINKQIEIIDSSTISLFKDILKCVGRKPINGKNKGGIKLHTVINVDETVPKMIWFSSAATHDHMLLEKLKLDSNTIYAFNKDYNDYKAFRRFTDAGTGFVTRIKDNAAYDIVVENFITYSIHSGVEKDTNIVVTIKENNKKMPLKLRKYSFMTEC